jgi:hypothetical protein
MNAMLLLSCSLGVLGVPTAPACDQGLVAIVAAETVSGVIMSTDFPNNSFVISSEGKSVTVRINDKTEYLLDGQKSTRDATLKVGAKASVTHDANLASRVSVSTTKPE